MKVVDDPADGKRALEVFGNGMKSVDGEAAGG
jgi:hypothetical protein